MTLEPTAGAKMLYLIKRRPETSRDELIAHWYANHMPAVIARMERDAEKGRPHATRYLATLFQPDAEGNQAWDGVAQLWWDDVVAQPAEPHGTTPTDSFQERAETYVPWATTEYVVIDGSDRLPVIPLTLNAPFPTTRSGFFKMTSLVKAQQGADIAALFDHWLNVHVPNVRANMENVGGLRYVVSHSIDPEQADYVGMAELYFDDEPGWRAFVKAFQPDGLEQWTDATGTTFLSSGTEMIGIA